MDLMIITFKKIFFNCFKAHYNRNMIFPRPDANEKEMTKMLKYMALNKRGGELFMKDFRKL